MPTLKKERENRQGNHQSFRDPDASLTDATVNLQNRYTRNLNSDPAMTAFVLAAGVGPVNATVMLMPLALVLLFINMSAHSLGLFKMRIVYEFNGRDRVSKEPRQVMVAASASEVYFRNYRLDPNSHGNPNHPRHRLRPALCGGPEA